MNACGAILAGALAAAVAGAPAAAATSDPLVTAVELRADRPPDRAAALADLIEVVPGRPLDREAVRASLRNLQASGEAGQVEAWLVPDPGGVEVVFALRTLQQVSEVALVGQLGARASELRGYLEQRAGEPLSESRVVRGVYRLQEALEARGYLAPAVRVEVATDEARGTARVVYHVASGEQATVREVRFEGDLAGLEAERLRERLRAGPGARFRRDVARQDAERLETWLIAEGRRRARVGRPREIANVESARVDLVFPLDAGPRFEIAVAGADADKLRKRGVLPLVEERFDEALLLQTVEGLVRHYQERGHYRASVEVERTPPDGVVAITLRIEAGPVFSLRRLAFSGNESFSSERLAELMATAPRRVLAPGSGRLVDAVLEEDLRNLRSFYALQGFGQVEVGPPRIEVAGDELEVEVPIVEGPRRRVVDLTFEGTISFPVADLERRLAITAGGPYHPRLLEESRDALRAFYEERGYPWAQIEAQLDWNEERTLADLRFRVLEGPRSLVDRIILRGNRHTRPSVVRRASELERGQPITTRRLLEMQRSLYGLGIFSRVDVDLAPAAPFSGRRDVLVRVDEARRRRVIYGLGYDSEDGPRGLLGYGQENLWGRGVSGRFDLRVSDRDRQVRALLRQPYPGGWRIPITYSLAAVEESHESFVSSRRGFQVEAERPRRRYDLGLVFTYKVVEVDELDPALSELVIDRNLRQVEISSLAPRLRVDRRDDPLLPERGWSASLVGEVAFPLAAAETEFLKLFGQVTGYLPLGRAGGLAASLRGGAIEPTGRGAVVDPTLPPGLASAQIPISERFFAGGRTTHRAYRRDRLAIPGETALSIVDPAGISADRLVPVGGNGLVLFNLDYRFPIAGPVGGTLFADFGNVWADWRNVDLSQGKAGAGIGLRYLSPIGPLRLDIGWKFDREPDEDPAVVFFSFGYPF